MIWLSASVALAVPADLADQWAAVEPEIRARTGVPVPLSPDDLATIAAGGAVASRFDTDRGAYATGAVWVDAPVDQVWLVVNDGEHAPGGRTTLRVLPAPDGIRRVHLTLALPFPIADRQWVSNIVPSRELYEATGGRVWQRTWSLADASLAEEPDNAVWLKENRGAWTLVDVGDGTLLMFTVRTVLGGLLPASITQGWAVRSLRDNFEETATRASAMPAHYEGEHRVIRNPGGGEITRWPR